MFFVISKEKPRIHVNAFLLFLFRSFLLAKLVGSNSFQCERVHFILIFLFSLAAAEEGKTKKLKRAGIKISAIALKKESRAEGNVYGVIFWSIGPSNEWYIACWLFEVYVLYKYRTEIPWITSCVRAYIFLMFLCHYTIWSLTVGRSSNSQFNEQAFIYTHVTIWEATPL